MVPYLVYIDKQKTVMLWSTSNLNLYFSSEYNAKKKKFYSRKPEHIGIQWKWRKNSDILKWECYDPNEHISLHKHPGVERNKREDWILHNTVINR